MPENGAKVFLLRIFGAIALCMAFAVAVSSSNSKWTAARVEKGAAQEEASSYRGVFKAFEVSAILCFGAREGERERAGESLSMNADFPSRTKHSVCLTRAAALTAGRNRA